jgi:hypothetical protein
VGHRVAAFQRHRAALASAAVGVAVEGVAHPAAVCRGEAVAFGRFELHRVAARLQPVEEVVALFVGGLRGHHLAAAVQQFDRDVGQASFAGVLLAVAVAVHPHPVTQAGAAVQARVDARVGLAGFELHGTALWPSAPMSLSVASSLPASIGLSVQPSGGLTCTV